MNLSVSKSVTRLIIILTCFCCLQGTGQNLKTDHQVLDFNKVGKQWDSLINAEQHSKAASLYFKTGKILKSPQLFVYAAWQYGKANMPDSAMIAINYSISHGMMNPNVLSEWELENTGIGTALRKRTDKRLDSIKQCISRVENFQISTESLDTFWPYFDAALADKDHAQQYFAKYIIDGPPAIKDYYIQRYENVANMVKQMIIKSPNLYQYTHTYFNQDRVSNLKNELTRTMHNLSKCYQAAVYPKIYIIPGIVSSNGIQTDIGLFSSAEMFVKTDNTPLTGLNTWQKENIWKIETMAYVLMHELMHFQQSYHDYKNKETLLGNVIKEGSCDFMVEITSGSSKKFNDQRYEKITYLDDPKHLVFILSEFKKEMYSTNLKKWLYNGGGIKDRPEDMGYALGYKICKSYYQRSKNKNAAIYELLNTDSFEKILKGSEYAYLLN